MKRIDDKLLELEMFIEQLRSIAPASLNEYQTNIEKKAACERFVEKIVEVILDVAFLLIKLKKLRIPEDDADAFRVLLESKIINDQLATKLKNAKGMRNVIVHQYGKVDDAVVFTSITEELEGDVKMFIELVRKGYKRN